MIDHTIFSALFRDPAFAIPRSVLLPLAHEMTFDNEPLYLIGPFVDLR
jgi:hypothetical protein